MREVVKVSGTESTISDALKRIPPHSTDAEQSVLGGLMLDNKTWDTVAEILTEEDFYRKDHRLVFRALDQLAADNHPLDLVTVSEWLEKRNLLAEAGGQPYLGSLVRNVPSAANIRTYAGIVRERSILRQLVHVSTEIGDSAFNPEGRNSAEILDHAESLVFNIAEQQARGGKGFESVKDLLVKVVDRIDKLSSMEGSITGVSTGYKDLDNMTSGLQPGDMVIVAGRPSMGKTSFAMNLAEEAAIKSRLPVAIFSMEMPSEQLVMRMLSSLGHVDQNRVRTGKLGSDDWPRLTSAMNLLGDARLFIDDTPALTPNELRAKARRIMRDLEREPVVEGGEPKRLGLIVIDYLQLMQIPGHKENRTNEISEISRNIKSLAKELKVPVIALSQLNRSLEQRPNKRPQMSDLRESGAIEQDADLIMFIYRDEVYNEDSPDKGIAEIIIGKQRNGPIGTVRLTFLGQYTRFENYISESTYRGFE
ncbi:MAG: replicative DNA helicase [Gammaproteobacteria bacterium]|nr:replicative DNA helicase [Gammaproteobacteria bacterium]